MAYRIPLSVSHDVCLFNSCLAVISFRPFLLLPPPPPLPLPLPPSLPSLALSPSQADILGYVVVVLASWHTVFLVLFFDSVRQCDAVCLCFIITMSLPASTCIRNLLCSRHRSSLSLSLSLSPLSVRLCVCLSACLPLSLPRII